MIGHKEYFSTDVLFKFNGISNQEEQVPSYSVLSIQRILVRYSGLDLEETAIFHIMGKAPLIFYLYMYPQKDDCYADIVLNTPIIIVPHQLWKIVAENDTLVFGKLKTEI